MKLKLPSFHSSVPTSPTDLYNQRHESVERTRSASTNDIDPSMASVSQQADSEELDIVSMKDEVSFYSILY